MAHRPVCQPRRVYDGHGVRGVDAMSRRLQGRRPGSHGLRPRRTGAGAARAPTFAGLADPPRDDGAERVNPLN